MRAITLVKIKVTRGVCTPFFTLTVTRGNFPPVALHSSRTVLHRMPVLQGAVLHNSSSSRGPRSALSSAGTLLLNSLQGSVLRSSSSRGPIHIQFSKNALWQEAHSAHVAVPHMPHMLTLLQGAVLRSSSRGPAASP
jgi:hypothetical protein